ncbi:MAG: hypothetical protein ABIK62_00105 [candidate division WOR-3 bacterium]
MESGAKTDQEFRTGRTASYPPRRRVWVRPDIARPVTPRRQLEWLTGLILRSDRLRRGYSLRGAVLAVAALIPGLCACLLLFATTREHASPLGIVTSVLLLAVFALACLALDFALRAAVPSLDLGFKIKLDKKVVGRLFYNPVETLERFPSPASLHERVTHMTLEETIELASKEVWALMQLQLRRLELLRRAGAWLLASTLCLILCMILRLLPRLPALVGGNPL